MSAAPTTEAARVTIIVASDAMSAQIKLRMSGSGEPLTEKEVLAALDGVGLDITDVVRAKAAAFIAAVTEDKNNQEGFPIAEASPPAPAVNGRLEWAPNFVSAADDWHDDGEQGLYSANAVVIVEKDAAIGRIVDPQPAHDGKDVRGKTIKLDRSLRTNPLPLTIDDTIRRSEDDALDLISNRRGRVVQTGQQLSIVEVLEIDGSVDHETGNVETALAVFVGDRVVDGSSVTAGGSVTVGSAVEAANITSGGDVVVRRGILGQSKGWVRAEGSITARDASEANLAAGQDLKVGKQLMNSFGCLGGQLIAPTASLIGGRLFAGGCVEIHDIGSEANVVTRLVVGVVAHAVHELAELADRIKQTKTMAERMRALLQPLLDAANPLDEKRRDLVTAYLSLAEKAEARVRDDDARREKLHEQLYTETVPSIQVLGTIYGGVTIQLGNRETVFRDDYEGPVLLERRKIKNVTEIVAVNPSTKSVKVLKSERTSAEALVESLERDA